MNPKRFRTTWVAVFLTSATFIASIISWIRTPHWDPTKPDVGANAILLKLDIVTVFNDALTLLALCLLLISEKWGRRAFIGIAAWFVWLILGLPFKYWIVDSIPLHKFDVWWSWVMGVVWLAALIKVFVENVSQKKMALSPSI